MKKLFLILLIGFFFSGNANAKEKIYCLDLDNFGFKYIYVDSVIERQYNLTAYETLDKNDNQNCKENVPNSINHHKFVNIDESFYKSFPKTFESYKYIPFVDLEKYFKNKNININLKKILSDGKKSLNEAEDSSSKKNREQRLKDLKVKLCRDKIEYSWNTYQLDNMATFEFKSSCERATYITDLIIYTADGKEMTRYSPPDGYIRPYGVKTIQFYIGDLNKDLIKTASYLNKMEKPKGATKSSKSDKSNKSDKYDWVAYIVFIVIGFIIFAGVMSIFEDDKKNKTIQVNTNQNKISNKDILSKVWNGEETMSRTFWIYCILLGLIVGGASGVLAGLYSNYFYIIAGIYIIWSNIGLWNSSNRYRQAKLSSKQPYGWSTAAKVYVVFNFLTTLSQAGFILRGF